MRVDRVAQPQPHVGRDLVVARAAGVQALAGIADQRGQARLDVEVHVLEVERPGERAARRSRRGSAPGRARWRRGRRAEMMPLRGQHLGMGEASRRCRRGQSRWSKPTDAV